MPFTYRVDPAHQIGLVAWRGRVSGEQIIEAMDALFGDPAWQPGFRHCWDGRAISELVLDLPETGAIVKHLREMAGQMGKGRAATVNPAEIHWLAARTLIVMSRLGLPEAKVCTTLNEAAAWLEVPVEVLMGT